MLSPGALLQNRYRIHQIIDSGGMAIVYLAEDTRLPGHYCAVKEMSPAQLPPQDQNWAITAYRQEAQILAALNHRGIVHVTLNYIAQLCDVFEYLHTQNPPIIFRDLKPGNVMITTVGEVKLIDFGIARFFKPGQTHNTVNLGTPGYASPEHGGKGQTDPRSDVYSRIVLRRGRAIHKAARNYARARLHGHSVCPGGHRSDDNTDADVASVTINRYADSDRNIDAAGSAVVSATNCFLARRCRLLGLDRTRHRYRTRDALSMGRKHQSHFARPTCGAYDLCVANEVTGGMWLLRESNGSFTIQQQLTSDPKDWAADIFP